MASVAPESSARSLEMLEAFLESDAAPPDAMPISVLDGYLTAIAIGPELIMPSVWLPEVWGGGSPNFADLDEANRVIGAMMARYNAILLGLDDDPPRCEPIFEADEEGRVVPDRWAEGFVAGLALGGESWSAILEDEMGYALTLPILGICVDDAGRSRLDLDAAMVAQLAENAPEMIPRSVIAIRIFWKARGILPPRRAGRRPAKRRTGLNR